ncbi:Integral membrane protein TerC family protein [Roseovarius marisflavi]|uniref:Integral membrane protein TerC family protein n=1 Tax=Roseovarius marisflavi TaxID=1054996 RepID=A0A1M6X1I2_9RHOB|nr:Integral membrane protein TerC family protein [Roseovarius marisflavi]
MADLLTLENLFNLLMLCFLQAVLGFDNLLYISIESQRAPVAHQKAVRFWGIIIAVALRVVLLFVMMNLIFSFDSVLSALAITKVFPILATAILLSGLAMLVLADGVT